MNLFDIIVLAIALSLDATIVSFSNGLIFREKRFKKSLALASTVGFFQLLMPVIGYFFTQPVTKYLTPYSKFIVFCIFFLLGLSFIKNAFCEEHNPQNNFLRKRYLLAVGIATSIDALFAGVSLSFSGLSILIPSVIIGFITFINSMLGFWTTNLIRNLSGKNMQISGGVILILLAFKLLLF